MTDDHGELRGLVGLALVHEVDHTDRLILAPDVDGERVVRIRELPVLEQPLDRRTAQGRWRPTRQVPDLRVPVPLRVEVVVLAGVTPKFDPLAFQLPGSVVKPHGLEYTGFGGNAPRYILCSRTCFSGHFAILAEIVGTMRGVARGRSRVEGPWRTPLSGIGSSTRNALLPW